MYSKDWIQDYKDIETYKIGINIHEYTYIHVYKIIGKRMRNKTKTQKRSQLELIICII